MYIINIFIDMWKVIRVYWKQLLVTGVSNTLLLAAIAVTAGTVIGSLLAFGRRVKFKPLNFLIGAFVEIIRGTPALVQIYIAYFFVPQIITSMKYMNSNVMAFGCAAVTLTLNSAAYVSEIIRSGIEAVDVGQTEAARSLGLKSSTTMLHIVLPQAVKNILPALGNEFITIIKETSLASTFFAGELMTQYKSIIGVTHNALPTYLVIALIYFVLDFILSKALKKFERRMKKHA